MFTHPLDKDNILIRVEFSEHAKRHFLKYFEKTYKGKRWQLTEASIIEDISRIGIHEYSLQNTQQVDELWHKEDFWLFKYDFTVAGTKKSPKNAGNRCVIFLNTKEHIAKILLIYHKSHLPKNIGEQQWITQILQKEFTDYLKLIK